MFSRVWLITLVVLMFLFSSTIEESHATQTCHGHSCPPPTFVIRCAASLCLNGTPYHFTGLNIYNANSRDNCWYSLGFNDSALTTALTASGAHTFRAWFFEREAGTSIARNWAAFDHTLAVAKLAGVKIVATLANQWGACEDNLYKSEAWYAGGYLANYRKWVIDVVSRYRNDPTILAWQLMNEAEDLTNGICSTTAETTLHIWATDMATVVKNADPNHLLNMGSMSSGQCGTSSGTSYENLLAIPQFDLAEYHDYGHPTEPMPGDQWNGLATRLNQAIAQGKPLFVGEAGIEATDPNRANEFAAKINTQLNAGVVGFLPWEWGSQPGGDQYVIGPGDPILSILAMH